MGTPTVRIKDITVSAVIPTAQYANITPAITVEVDDDIEQAKALAMQHIVGISQKYAEAGKALPSMKATANAKRIECLVGGSVLYDDVAHVYTNEQGDVYLSGSKYASQGEPEFNLDGIAGAMGKKFNADTDAIKEMWKLKGDVSAGFGTAIHAAVQLYEQYSKLAESIDKTTNLHDHPVLKEAVEKFISAHRGEEVINEPMVVSHERKWAGQIDRLVITGDKRCIVGDIKTNAELSKKKLTTYWKQLKFYGTIMEDAGWTVDSLEIYHYDGNWKTIKEPMESIK